MKKVVFILSRFPWPVDTGQKGLIAYWCEIIRLQLNMEVHLFVPNSDLVDENEIPDYISSCTFGEKIGFFSKMFNILVKSIVKSWPLQCSLFYNRKNAKQLKELLKTVDPEFIIFDMIRVMPYYKLIKSGKKIMNLGDLLSDRYDLQLKSKYEEDIFGQSSEKGIFRKAAKIKILRKMALKFEKKKVYKSELKTSKIFEKVIFISEKEKNIYETRTNSNISCVVPIGVDYEYFSQTNNDIRNNTLVFLGNLNYGPNYASVKYICEKIFPLIEHNVKLIFIGNAPKDLVEKYQTNSIVFCGRIDDTRTVIGKAALFFAPIAYGTGIKTKIIEAMAMGKCVVTNNVGAENIDAVYGTDLIVENTTEALAKAVDKLLDNLALIEKVGNSAKKKAEKYAYSNVRKSLEQIIN